MVDMETGDGATRKAVARAQGQKVVEIYIEDGIVHGIEMDEGAYLVILDVDDQAESDAPVIEKHYVRGADGKDEVVYRDEREEL